MSAPRGCARRGALRRAALRRSGTDLRVGLLPARSGSRRGSRRSTGSPTFPTCRRRRPSAPRPARVDASCAARSRWSVRLDRTRADAALRGWPPSRSSGVGRTNAERAARPRRRRAAAREVALVDGDGRVGPLQTTFYDTLLDENAASHIAFGQGYEFSVDESDVARVNKSGLHVDVMIAARRAGHGGDGCR